MVLALVPLAIAWVQVALRGPPYIAPNPASASGAASGPHGFPVWIRWCHFFNLFFTFMQIRSGLSILMDHPRLYFNDGCTPGTEWIRFTPLRVTKDRIWTAKDDNRYISLISCRARPEILALGATVSELFSFGFIRDGSGWFGLGSFHTSRDRKES